jgi:hypothetical protein
MGKQPGWIEGNRDDYLIGREKPRGDTEDEQN